MKTMRTKSILFRDLRPGDVFSDIDGTVAVKGNESDAFLVDTNQFYTYLSGDSVTLLPDAVLLLEKHDPETN